MRKKIAVGDFALSAPLLVANAFSGVTTTFVNAVTAFNEQNLPELEDLFVDHVVVYKINNGSPVKGKRLVAKYLNDEVMPDKPIFAPVTTVLHPPTLPTSVRGVALWRDNDNAAPTTLPIRYEFHFQPDPPYLITSLWATPD